MLWLSGYTENCQVPVAPNISQNYVTNSTAQLSISLAMEKFAHKVRYRVQGTTDWATIDLKKGSRGFYTITGLTPNSNYEVQLQRICSEGSSAYSSSTTFKTLLYCSASGSYSGDARYSVYITNMKLKDRSHASGPAHFIRSYSFFPESDLFNTLSASTSENFEITTNTAYYGGASIWLDLNQDNDFDDAGELVFAQTPNTSQSQKTIAGVIQIPAWAKAGTTRMRVRVYTSATAPGPCGGGSQGGEVEDYSVNITFSSISTNNSSSRELLWDGTFDNWRFGFKNRKGTRDQFWEKLETEEKGLELKAKGGPDYRFQSGMRTLKTYGNYELTMKYRWITKGPGDLAGNSGIWIHGEENWVQDNGGYPNSIEVQLKKGEAGDLLRKGMEITAEPGYPNIGRLEQIPRRNVAGLTEHFDGEYNLLKIVCKNNEITVYLNGLLINKGVNVRSKNGGKPINSGYITLQSELRDLAFKDIYIKQLPVCSINPFVNVNNTGSVAGSTAAVAEGETVILAPESAKFGTNGGTWSWTGPSNFTHSGRVLSLSNIQNNQLGAYVVTHTDQDACTSTVTYNIAAKKVIAAGTYHFRNVATGLYLDADPDGKVKVFNQIQYDDAKWNLLTSTTGYFYIDNGMVDRGPLAAAASLDNDVLYQAESLLNTPAAEREWKAIQVGENVYRFLCKDASRGYLTVVAGSQVKNTNDATSEASQWELVTLASSRTTTSSPSSFASLAKENSSSNMTIAPVPNNGSFTINFKQQKALNVLIYNALGQLVYKKDFGSKGANSSFLKVNKHLKPGVYMVLSIDTEGHRSSTRFVVK